MRYPSHIYVMSAPDGLVKVGLSRNLDGRVKALSTDNKPLVLEWATPRHHDPLTIEMTAHTLLASSHAKGEWFRVSVEEAIAAVSQAACMIDLGDKSKRRRARATTRAIAAHQFGRTARQRGNGHMLSDDKITEPGNDNKPTARMTFDELMEKSGLDEDALLQRIANIMSRRDARVDPL